MITSLKTFWIVNVRIYTSASCRELLSRDIKLSSNW